MDAYMLTLSKSFLVPAVVLVHKNMQNIWPYFGNKFREENDPRLW